MNENEGLYLHLKTFKTTLIGLYGNNNPEKIKTLNFFITNNSYLLKINDNIVSSQEHSLNGINSEYHPMFLIKVNKEEKKEANKIYRLICPISQLIYVPINKNIDIIKNKLWFVINSGKEELKKIENKNQDNKQENIIMTNENEFQNADYYLNENDVIKFGNIIYIVKEIHIRKGKEEVKEIIKKNENEKDKINNYDIHKLNVNNGKKLIFNSSYQEDIILKSKDSKNLNDYNYCEHIISCMTSKEKSDKIKEIKDLINQYKVVIENKSKTVITYKLILHKCETCNKESNEDLNIIYPLRFKTSENSEIYELIDIEKDENKDYIILESLEIISNGPIIKYIHFIELKGDENEEYIKIGRDHNTNDVINDEKTISRHHAFIKYNKNDKTLILKNISENSITSVLLRFATLNILKNKEICLQSGETVFTIKIMTKEIYNKIEEEFNKIKEEEKKKENEKKEEEAKKYKNEEYSSSSVKNFYS